MLEKRRIGQDHASGGSVLYRPTLDAAHTSVAAVVPQSFPESQPDLQTLPRNCGGGSCEGTGAVGGTASTPVAEERPHPGGGNAAIAQQLTYSRSPYVRGGL
jgi:hypothetical protein